MTARDGTLTVDPRFCGPPGTANGGFACGTVAARSDGPAEVTLRRPLPLSRPLRVRAEDDGGLVVLDGTTPVAEARAIPADAEPDVPAVASDVADAVAGRAAYFEDPAFPGCFVCGPDRAPGDGLRIFPGPVPGRLVWAAPWTPDPSVAAGDGTVRGAVVWAALDCPAGIAAGEAGDLPDGTTAVLGRMTASVAQLPRAGEPCRVVAWPGARTARTLAAGSALLGPDGDVLATARSLWVTVPRPVHRPAERAAS